MDEPYDDADSTEPVNEDDLQPLGESEGVRLDDPDVDTDFADYQGGDDEGALEPDEVPPEVRF